ncbi:hypothetical protein Xcel_1946 [Xylanimonas cellulosilytica DSM 15894]|uniref:Uncharacterized protein n=1 Tax=Xylanimonas cellulosilytica (strain DSM 15894 / JCM 12276 / CECT 5975 / KCTC 9989 / LMG 20990 / NBRC 107835 / XIL07) TaxID=446471 RepID=D1BTI6_XYLCX|nr:hypothetical protein [Xylanimonas cellulosilytica]ACZ30965.1 hypothetical protein Xcel_1946 [Xylanimonas cellulosilytica DSM 15894]
MTDLDERPRFYEGQYLGAADLTAAVEYSRTQLARAVLGAHRWGIALGLDLVEVPGPHGTIDVFVEPGYAWDGFGRAILVTEPTRISTALFGRFDVEDGSTPPSVVVPVWIRYDETMTQGPRPGFETCEGDLAYARVQGSFRIEVGPRATLETRRDPVQVAGRTMDAATALQAFDAAAPEVVDADVPHQVLPAGPGRQWLVPLGVVTWKPGGPGRFEARDAATQTRSLRARQHAGIVAASVEINGGHLALRDRTTTPSREHTDELVWVEGHTRVDGNVALYHGRLALRTDHAAGPAPYEVARTESPLADRTTLRLVIGDEDKGANRLAVGPQSGGGYAEHLVVTDDGKVGVGVAEPRAPLHVQADGIEIGSGAPTENFYMQSNTDGPSRGLRTYVGDVGAGELLASLTNQGRLGLGVPDPKAPLHVPDAGIQVGARATSSQNFFAQADETGGPRALRVYTGNAPTGTPRATLTATGRLGLGTTEPLAPLHVPEAGIQIGTSATESGNFHVRSSVSSGIRGLRFYRGNAGSGTAVATLTGDARLGLGTQTPQAALDVVGDARFTGHVRASGLVAAGAIQATRILWGVVESDGTIRSGTGFTVERQPPGRYRLHFAQPFVAAPPAVVASRVYGDPDIDAGTGWSASENVTVDMVSMSTALIVTASATGTHIDGAFTFIAIGVHP